MKLEMATAAIPTAEIFLIAMGIIFTVPYLIWRVLRTDYYAPLVVVQILAGILLGPGILGRVCPAYYAFVFRPDVIALLNGIAWWAVRIETPCSIERLPYITPTVRRSAASDIKSAPASAGYSS